MKKSVFAFSLAAIFILSALPFHVSGESEISFYVSPAGSDENSGTEASPFKTIARAQDAVREINTSQASDITVYLRGGTYYLEEPIKLTEEDGGRNGFRVHYKNYEGEAPVISGGRVITGWQEGEGGIWQASLDLGENYALSMDVDGVPARRAESEEPGRLLRGYYDASDENDDLDGFYTKSESLSASQENQQDIQVQLAYMWRTYIYNVDAIVTNPENEEESIVKVSRQIQLEESDLNSQIALLEANGGAANWGYTILNAKEELDTPGEFYYDRQAKTIYYLPRSGEDMNTLVAEVPVLEQLVDIRGGDAHNKVKNISFSGIVFSHASWQDMARYGFHTGQTQDFYAQPEMLGRNDFVGKFFVPAAVQLNMTDGITFESNTFRALDCVAIGLYQGAYNTKINGNKFYDLGDSAVTIGLPNQAYESTVVEGRNLAEGKKVTEYPVRTIAAEKRYYQNFLPEAAVEPNKNFGWHGVYVNGEKSWLQVDLGEAYEIDRIEIEARQDADQKPARRNFQVLASTDDPNFTDGNYDVLGSIGWDNGEEEIFGHKGTWTQEVSATTKYRYVRVIKTFSELFYINELRVINKSMDFAPKYQLSRHTEVTNNVIERVSKRNWGAPGLHTYFTEDALIANNDISDLPYSGICVGWGWNNYLGMTICRDIKIKNNRIDNVMKKMVDGGGIYTLGPQPNSEISGNFISNMSNAISGVYLDSGSNFFTVKNNVFEDVVLTTTGGSGTYTDADGVVYPSENHLYDNFTTSPYGSSASLQSPSANGTLVEAAVFMEGNYPAAAVEIIKNAGLTEAWRHLKNEIPEKAFADKEWETYDNVLHVTNYGSMHDRRFLDWHLRYIAERARDLLSIARENTGDGYLEYPEEAVTAFEAAINAADEYYNAWAPKVPWSSSVLSTQLPLNTEGNSRKTVLENRDKLRGATEALAASLNVRTTDELISIAKASTVSERLPALAEEAEKAKTSQNADLIRCLQLEMERELRPELKSVKTDSADLCLLFNNKLKADTVSAESITVSDENGETVSYDKLSVNGSIVCISGADMKSGNAYTVTVGGSIQNTEGVACGKTQSMAFIADGFGISLATYDSETDGNALEEIKADTGFYARLRFVNRETEPRTVMLALALYDENRRLISLNMEDKEAPGGEEVSLTAGRVMPDRVDALNSKIFIWDFNKMMPLWTKGETQ